MIAYYEITEDIRDFFQTDPEINTVEIGNFFDLDLKKAEIYAIAGIIADNPEFINGVVRFNVNIIVMDLVDERRLNDDELPADERWKGQNNKQDVHNQLLATLERFDNSLTKGGLQDKGWELIGTPVINQFEERGDNMLAGWTGSYQIDIPNTVQNC